MGVLTPEELPEAVADAPFKTVEVDFLLEWPPVLVPFT